MKSDREWAQRFQRKRGPKKVAETVVSNPFTEIQNKRRSAILGQKVKGQKRNVQKARQDQARERTTKLLDELRTQNRTTTFKDARFGDNLDYDETMLKRFEKERKKQAKRSFALDDNVELTHGGVSIGNVPDEELKGGDLDGDHELDAEAEREAMKMLQSENFSGSGDFKTREEIYKEIIAKSKRRKIDLYREKEEQERELNLFNAGFEDIVSELQMKPKKTKLDGPEQSAEDKQYDIMAKNFAFERKAEASDRLKTKEELAEQKAAKLAKLEQERKDRMTGIEKKAKRATAGEECDEDDDEGDEDQDEDEDEDEDSMAEESAENGAAAGEVEELAGSEGEDEEAEEEEGEAEDEEECEDDEEEESVDLGVDITNTVVPRSAAISLPEKSYPSYFRPGADIDTMVNLNDEDHLPFAVEVPTSVKAYASLEKYGLQHFAKVVLRARVIARQKANKMVRPLLDYLTGTMATKGFATLYALEPVLLEFVEEFGKDIFAYFSEKIDAMGDIELPTMEHLAVAKLAAHVFPTTDLWHPIITSVVMLLDRWSFAMTVNACTQSRALLLFGLLYEYTSPAKRYSPGIFVLGKQLNCSQIKSALADLSASFGVCPMGLGEAKSLAPLRLHYTPPPQVEMLEPAFHGTGDGPIKKGDQKRSEELRLRRKYNDERRAAARNLRRDQEMLQVVKTRKSEKAARVEQAERKRVRRIMDIEDKEVKQIMMQHSGMDTSLNPYSQNKKRKKENARMAGNETVDTKKPKKSKPSKK